MTSDPIDIKKREDQIIRVELVDYRGKSYVDARVFGLDPNGIGRPRPFKQGLRLTATQAKLLAAALAGKADEAIQQMERWSHSDD